MYGVIERRSKCSLRKCSIKKGKEEDEQVSFVWLVMEGERKDCSQDKVVNYHKIKYQDRFQNGHF